MSYLVVASFSPAVRADKKDRSNSNSDDDKRDKDKDNGNQSGRNSKSNSQQSQNLQQNQQFKSNKGDGSQQMQKGQQNNQQNNNQFQLQQQNSQKQFQNFQKQGNGPQLGQKQNDSQQFLQKQKNSKQDGEKVNLPVINDKPDWMSKNSKNKKEIQNFAVKVGGSEPFSSKWYKDHPHAWHHHHDNDTWKVVTAAGVVGFLGWELYHPRNTVVVYQPVPYDTLFVSRPGVIIDPSRGEWMPLGTYSVMLGPGDMSTRMLDLDLDRFGHIRGSYYDMVSNATYNVAGIVDQRSQYAQWALESNRQLTFYTPLGEMMQPQGAVYVQLPSGERQQWQLGRMEGNGGY